MQTGHPNAQLNQTMRNPRDIPQKIVEYTRKHEKYQKANETKSEQTDRHAGQIDTAKATVLCCVRVRACVRACMQASKAKQFPGCGNPPNLR